MMQGTRKTVAQLGALSALVGACVLFSFPPAEFSFYPRCPVSLWLHLDCPGCGGTRALAALLHGHIQEAIHWNALLVFLLPGIFAFLAVSYWRALKPGEFIWPRLPESAMRACLVFVAAFTIFRNIHGI